MKRFYLSLLLAISSLLPTFSRSSSTTMTSIINKSSELVKFVEDEMDMEIVRLECDILRTTKTTTRILSKGWTYAIIAYGDYRFKDIDIKVYRNVQGSWQLVAKDNDSSASSVVSIEPQSDGEYLIEISAYSFEPGYDVGHYGLIIAHE